MLAAAAQNGIDPMRILECEDRLEMEVWRRIVMAAVELQAKIREDLAVRIISELSKALGRNRSGGRSSAGSSTRAYSD